MSVIYLDPTDYVRFQDSDLNYSIWSPKYLADAVRFYRDNSTCTCTCKKDLATKADVTTVYDNLVHDIDALRRRLDAIAEAAQ